MLVENLKSKSSGCDVPNQFVITDHINGNQYFQSYNKIIIMIDYSVQRDIYDYGQVYLDKNYYNFSRTTARYRNQFLGLTSEEVEDNIKSGEFILTDLNNG